ncbi:MAG: cell envelope integrity protein TolA [Gammaproteobacteria bacterium]|nr:cell envelope integrity protein TolA [Gammaproteobacteria bacterium]
MTLALLLHVIVFGSLFVAFDWSRQTPRVIPLAITATLITETGAVVPPPVEREPEPLPAPEPEVVEPEPIEPDPAEQARLQAEEQKRLDDQRAEEQRLQRIEDEKAEAERKAAEEAELERKRRELEEQRQRDIEMQREENRREEDRLLQEAQAAAVEEEAERLEMMGSNEMLAYQAAIQQKVIRNWIRPATAPDDLECFVAVQQLPNGEVTRVQVRQCNGDDVVVRSIEAAVRKASPLPLPSNPILFLRDFEFRFTIQD